MEVTSVSDIGRNMVIDSELDQVSVHNDRDQDASKIFKEGIYYIDFRSTDEVKRDDRDGCSSRLESNGGSLQVAQYFYGTHICFDNIFSLILECTCSFHGHGIENIIYFLDDETDMKFLWNRSQIVDDEILE